jgi:nucleotide-binding universal stress UspA family protein
MMRLPAAVERRRHDVVPPPRSDRYAVTPTIVRVEGSPAPVAAAPAEDLGARSTSPRIAVGVDGSPASVEALRWAARHADLTGAAVEAVISWDYPSTSGMEFGSLDIDWAGNARDALSDALHVALGEAASQVTGTVTRGHPAEVLVDAAQGAALLVVGARGHMALTGRGSARTANTSPPAPPARSWWSGTSRIRSPSGSARTSLIEKCC